MNTRVRQIALDKLIPHPDNPNRMSRGNFAKLVRNIKRTGHYEPIVVRRHPHQRGCFQIINGHHRCQALKRLGRKTAQAVVWDVDDEQTDILLTTLNRLAGRDVLDRKLAILRRLHGRMSARELSRLVPQTRGQLERLIALKRPSLVRTSSAEAFALPMVFFVTGDQQRTIEQALSQAQMVSSTKTRAARRAGALTDIARQYVTVVAGEEVAV